jgi:thiamine biosynthesis lipoprotein
VAGLIGAILVGSQSSIGEDRSAGGARAVSYSTKTMGTYAGVILVTADSAASAPHAQAAHATFARVDSLMSNWMTTSEVARLNREAAAGATGVHPEVAVVLDESMRIWRESDGAFDITVEPLVRAWGFLGGKPHVPSEEEARAAFALVGADQLEFDASAGTVAYRKEGVKIDLGGIAKGYAVDMAAEVLKEHGIRDALVDISGNMYALGSPPDADAWRLGIRDPRGRMSYFARLLITEEAVATSGKYEQFVAADGKEYGHILDPRTGRPAEGLISVTVVAPRAMAADAWGTALFVLGPDDAKAKAREREDISVVLVEPGEDEVDTVWVEEGLRYQFTLEGGARRLFRIEYF